MLGSWLCFQLLLGWVLLLGQPVCGVEGESEDQQSPLEGDFEGPLEGEEDLTSEELEARVRTEEALMEGDPQLLEMLTDRFSALAMDIFNKATDGPLFKLLDEDRRLTFKKAIGTMAYLRLFLGKTNCTNHHLEDHPRRDFIDKLLSGGNAPPPEFRRCVLPPLSERETLDCTFDIFLDERSYWETVTGHHCRPMGTSDAAETYNTADW